MSKQFNFKQSNLTWIYSLNIQLKVKKGNSKKFILVFIFTHKMTLSGATTSGQTGPRSDGNEGVLCIPQSSSITEASTLDCLVSYPGHPLGDTYPLCRDSFSVFYTLSQLGN